MNTTLITQHNIFNPHDRMVLPTYATHSSQVLEELLIADGFEVELYKVNAIGKFEFVKFICLVGVFKIATTPSVILVISHL